MTALRAVKGERAARPARKQKSVTEAAKSGTRRELLVAMRDRVAKAVESPDTLPRDLAALTRRLTDIVKEIEAIDAREGDAGDAPDEVGDGEFDASAV